MKTSEAIVALDQAQAAAHTAHAEYANRRAILDGIYDSNEHLVARIRLIAKNYVATNLLEMLACSKHLSSPEGRVEYLRAHYLPRSATETLDLLDRMMSVNIEEFREDLFYLFDEANYSLDTFTI